MCAVGEIPGPLDRRDRRGTIQAPVPT